MDHLVLGVRSVGMALMWSAITAMLYFPNHDGITFPLVILSGIIFGVGDFMRTNVPPQALFAMLATCAIVAVLFSCVRFLPEPYHSIAQWIALGYAVIGWIIVLRRAWLFVRDSRATATPV